MGVNNSLPIHVYQRIGSRFLGIQFDLRSLGGNTLFRAAALAISPPVRLP